MSYLFSLNVGMSNYLQRITHTPAHLLSPILNTALGFIWLSVGRGRGRVPVMTSIVFWRGWDISKGAWSVCWGKHAVQRRTKYWFIHSCVIAGGICCLVVWTFMCVWSLNELAWDPPLSLDTTEDERSNSKEMWNQLVGMCLLIDFVEPIVNQIYVLRLKVTQKLLLLWKCIRWSSCD